MRCNYYKYLSNDGTELFTVICKPQAEGKFPTVIFRDPYVDNHKTMTDEEVTNSVAEQYSNWLESGYVVVFQHCRGCGKSSGDCIPNAFERVDGLFLHDWVRSQDFYNGEIFLCGGSYAATVHLVTAPFAPDIKGAVIEVRDSERYNSLYRNGFYKVQVNGDWYVSMYKKNGGVTKSYTQDSLRMLPLSDFTKTVFGENAEDLDEILKHPDRNDEFWNTVQGGLETKDVVTNSKIPILLVTAFYDIYTGGIFDMWNALSDVVKSRCALAVHPFNHAGNGKNQPILFENGFLWKEFEDYQTCWMDYVRGKCDPPFTPGKITYYKLFGDKWCVDDFYDANDKVAFTLGDKSVTYKYNPYAPAYFKGGLSGNSDGTAWQDEPGKRYDIVTVYTPEFEKDTFIKGKISAKLRVASDCEDTCFYIRLSLCKSEGDYGLRHDINQISNFDKNYVPGTELYMDFNFDEHAFVVHKGEKIRIDISSSAYPHFVPHTNYKGLFSEQRCAKIATNTVDLSESYVVFPILND